MGFDSPICPCRGIAASAPPSPPALPDADFAPPPATPIAARHKTARRSTGVPYLLRFLIARVICLHRRGLRNNLSYVIEAGTETPNRKAIGRTRIPFVYGALSDIVGPAFRGGPLCPRLWHNHTRVCALGLPFSYLDAMANLHSI